VVYVLSETARKIIADGSIRMKVVRSGMHQFMVFKIKKISAGKDDYFIELFLDRVLDMTELHRVANETGLPVEAENGRAFPEGKGAKDFLDL
jgi:hypothetical protein